MEGKTGSEPRVEFLDPRTVTKNIELAYDAATKVNEVINAGATLTPEALEINVGLAEKAISADYDEMTGLYSPEKFEEDGARMTGPNLNVLVIDMGHLGYTNDAFGHPEGNKYKRKVAEIVGGRTEEMKAFMRVHKITFNGYALTSGDEMGILMKGSAEEARLLAAKIKEEVEKIGKITPSSEFDASVSVGMASGNEFKEELTAFFGENQGMNEELITFKFFAEMANFRSELDKVRGRLREMVTTLRDDPERFGRLFPYLTKGVIGVHRMALERLGRSGDYETDSDKLIRSGTAQRKEDDLLRTTDPLEIFQKEMELKMLGE